MNKKKALIGTGTLFAALAVLGGTVLGRKIIKNKQANEILGNDIYETGKIRKFGTLYLNGAKQKCPTDTTNHDDVYEYMGEKIEVRNSDKGDENKLMWVEVDDNNKKLLICDRNILKGISWDELNNQNLVFGKVVIIDGQKYILRLLKGGDKKKDDVDNEWNRYIVNEDQLQGLPVSTEYDTNEKINSSSLDKIDGLNNSLWHWVDICSLTQNIKREKSCIIRGFYSNTYINDVKKEVSYKTVGYRPVLEVID